MEVDWLGLNRLIRKKHKKIMGMRRVCVCGGGGTHVKIPFHIKLAVHGEPNPGFWGVAGWLLFMVFGGVGLVALPVGMIQDFFGRPRSTITKSEYITRAKGLGIRAKDIMVCHPVLL